MKRVTFVSLSVLLLLAAALFVPMHRARAQGGQTINMTTKQSATPSFTVTDNTGAAVPTSGYSVSGTIADPTIAAIDSNPTLIVPGTKTGSTTVTWTITGKGPYSGSFTLGPDTINVTQIPLGQASVTYAVQ